MKINITNLFELSKYLTTKSGQELKDALSYLADFVVVVISALTNKLNYEENFDCELKNVTIFSGQQFIIATNIAKRVKEIRIRRLINSTYYIVDKFGWYYNNDGNVVLQCFISGSPTVQINAEIIILY